MLTTLDITAALEAAVRAPSLHNSQPWRFCTRDGGIEVRVDPRRRLPVADPSGWAARLAIGAAIFNLRLAVAIQGWESQVRLLPDRSAPDLLGVVTPGARRPATPVEQRLAAAIPRWRSNRSPFCPDPVPAPARARLLAAARAESAWLDLLIGPGPVDAVAAVAQAADQVLMRRADYRAELAAWNRDTTTADGIPASTGWPSPGSQDLLPQRPYARRLRRHGEGLEPQPLVGVLGTTGDMPGDQLVAGQALQRVLLTATDDGLAVSLISQPIEVASAREQLRLALSRYGAPQMVLRIGFGTPGVVTPRRPVADVTESTTQTF